MLKTVVCYKTHILNKIILDFIKKLFNDCDNSNKQILDNFKGEHDIDFYLLIPDYLEKDLPDNFKFFTKIYKEEDIQNLYEGFYSMWLSNHFIELWFYKNFGDKYNYFWFMEYDVRILGDSSYFWRNELTHDLLVPRNITLADSSWKFYNYIHESFQENERYACPKQLCRISKKLLNKLDELFIEGINGHCELILGCVCKKYNFSFDHTFLNTRIQGIWTHNSDFSGYNLESYNKLIGPTIFKPYIFHPIKIIKKEEKQQESIKRSNNTIKLENKLEHKNINEKKQIQKNTFREEKKENTSKKILIKKKI